MGYPFDVSKGPDMKPHAPPDLAPFYPPRPNYAFIRLMQLLAPIILRIGWDLENVDISRNDLQRLRRLRDQSAIVIANHPSLAEPGVIFHSLGMAGVFAHSLSAWDTMALYGRLWRGFLQWIGGYSIMRGRRDRASMHMTQKLLAEGRRIIIFPEGQTYGLNDTLLPFQQGVIQMSFWALEDMQKHGITRPVYIAPLAIKYIYTENMNGAMEASLIRLEDAVGIRGPFGNRYSRLRQIASAVLGVIERDLGVSQPENKHLDDRIDLIRDEMIKRLSSVLEVELPRDATLQLKLQLLGNSLDEIAYPLRGEDADDHERGRDRMELDVKTLQAVWLRLKNFQAVRDGYVAENPTPERFLDVLGRLEFEVFGKSHIRGRRKASVSVAEFVDLRDHLPAYRENKRETVARLTEGLQETVGGMLGIGCRV
jgi:1-acyl-sn-glycerol-3-phosphate acyltransferase